MVEGGLTIKEETKNEIYPGNPGEEKPESLDITKDNNKKEYESKRKEKEEEYRKIYEGLGFNSEMVRKSVLKALMEDPDLRDYSPKEFGLADKPLEEKNPEKSAKTEKNETVRTEEMKPKSAFPKIIEPRKIKNEELKNTIELVKSAKNIFEASKILAKMISLEDNNLWKNISHQTVESVLNDSSIPQKAKEQINELSEIILEEKGIEAIDLKGKTVIGYVVQIINSLKGKS